MRELGARNVHTVYFGADPSVFNPTELEQDLDVAFYGISSVGREKYIESMIGRPSEKMNDKAFAVGGLGYAAELGRATQIGFSSFDKFRYFCCRSKINLNITRRWFAETYASSTSRPFELGALGCCIVSNPCLGIEEWFEPGKEIIVVHSEQEAIDAYERLLSSEEERMTLANNARKRVLREHTYADRARQLLDIFKTL